MIKYMSERTKYLAPCLQPPVKTLGISFLLKATLRCLEGDENKILRGRNKQPAGGLCVVADLEEVTAEGQRSFPL